MRQLIDIITQILAKVPQDHILYNELTKFAGEIGFTAPEAMGRRFKEMQQILMEELGIEPKEWGPTELWKFDVIRIWSDRPDMTDDQIRAAI